MQSRRDSQNPIRYIETAMELARKNIRPIAPPNSGPKILKQIEVFSKGQKTQYHKLR